MLLAHIQKLEGWYLCMVYLRYLEAVEMLQLGMVLLFLARLLLLFTELTESLIWQTISETMFLLMVFVQFLEQVCLQKLAMQQDQHQEQTL